jgi:hypothetical protein
MIKQFKEFLGIRLHFPLTKNEYGFYPSTYTQDGHYLRCPNCGGSTWSIKSYQHLECNTCYDEYRNMGVMGLEKI